MKKIFLFSKLHQATVTGADFNYEGSFSIDKELLDAAGILPNEQVQVYNITNGKRFTTYAIESLAGSREMCANGACAHLVSKGDRVIVCTYAELDESEIATHRPTVLLLDEENNFRVKNEASLTALTKEQSNFRYG